MPARQRAVGCSGSMPSVITAENRAFDAISRRNAEFARGAGDDFEHGADGSAGGNEPIGERFGIFRNSHNAAVTGNEDHVERNVGVVHPEGDRLILLEVEQHAVTLGQLFAKHQTAGPLRFGGRKFDAERVHTALADDIECRVAGGVQRRTGEQDQARGNKEICGITASGANCTGQADPTSG